MTYKFQTFNTYTPFVRTLLPFGNHNKGKWWTRKSCNLSLKTVWCANQNTSAFKVSAVKISLSSWRSLFYLHVVMHFFCVIQLVSGNAVMVKFIVYRINFYHDKRLIQFWCLFSPQLYKFKTNPSSLYVYVLVYMYV